VASSITSSPAIGDIDLDGDVEIAIGGMGIGNDSLYVWDLSVAYDTTRMPWPQFHHDPRHTGRLPLGPEIAVNEHYVMITKAGAVRSTIIKGPLLLPADKKCKVFDITGREVEPLRLISGIYFIEIDGKIAQKVIKIK